MGLFSRDARQTIAVVDVASGSIGGALFSVPEKGTMSFLSSARIPIRSKSDRIVGITRAFDELSYTLTQQAPARHTLFGTGAIDTAYISISAPWRKTGMRTEVRDEKRPFAITRALIAEAITPTEEPGKISSVRLISSTLNGYRVRDPIGKTVSHAEFALLESSVEKDVRDAVASGAKRLAPKAVSLEAVSSVPYALKSLYPRQADSLILIISEEETTFILMNGGLPADTGSIPLGTGSFMRAARVNGVPLPDTNSLIDTTRNRRLEEAVQKVEQVWLAALVNELRENANTAALPSTVFLIAGHEARNFVKRILEKRVFSALWVASETPHVIPMLPTHFDKVLTLPPSEEPDTLLACLALSVAASPRG